MASTECRPRDGCGRSAVGVRRNRAWAWPALGSGPCADYDQVLQLTTWLPLPFTNFVQLLGVFPVTFEVDVPVTDAVGPLAGIEIDTPPSGPLPVLELLVIIVDPCTCNVLVQYSTSNVTAA